MARSALLNIMVQAASKAGRALARDFGEVEKLQVSIKGPADFVSSADHRAEKILFEELSKARPGYGFLMEESGVVEGKDTSHRWVIDPLDGTTNFLHGNPNFCVSLGLERDGNFAAAVIYVPATGDIYTAERGAGAFLNDQRIRVAGRRSLSESLITIRMPNLARVKTAADSFRELGSLVPKVQGFRQTGSSALDLAYIAAGRFDGVFLWDISAWDMAAGIHLIREAGGIVTDRDGREAMMQTGEIVAGNEIIHRQLLDILTAARRG